MTLLKFCNFVDSYMSIAIPLAIDWRKDSHILQNVNLFLQILHILFDLRRRPMRQCRRHGSG